MNSVHTAYQGNLCNNFICFFEIVRFVVVFALCLLLDFRISRAKLELLCLREAPYV